MVYQRLFTCLFSLMLSTALPAETLRLVANAWPPFTGAQLQNNGLATDLVSTALQRAGYTSEYHEVPWARALQGIETDRYDVLVPTWFATERQAYGLYSEPYLTNRIRFMRRIGSTIEFKQLDDLLPYTIAVARGFAYAPTFDSDARLHKEVVSSFATAARMLAAGRVDLTLEDEWVAKYYLSHELAELSPALEFLPVPLSESPLHILVRRKHPQSGKIVSAFNQALRDMRADGSYTAILQRHGLQ